MYEHKNLLNASAWFFGVLFVLAGLVGILSISLFGNLFLLLSGLFLIPPAFERINARVNNSITIVPRVALILALFVFGNLLIPTDRDVVEDPTPEVKPPQASVQKEIKINSEVDEKRNVEKGKVLNVSDGDTLRVSIDGKSTLIRLIGIDTPEINHPSEPVQCYGPEAKKALEDLVLNKEVVLEKDVSDKDSFNRSLRYLWIGETLVNEYMVQRGYGFSASYPPDTKYQKRFDAGQLSAKSALSGLWASTTCNGDVNTGTYKDPNKVSQAPVTEDKTPTTPPSKLYVVPPVPVSPPPQNTESASYTCSCSKTCAQMSSCEEAQYQLNVCGCSARDGDDDGVACDSNCQ